MLVRYDSVAQLRQAWIDNPHGERGWESDVEWYGGETREDTKRLSYVGDTKLVPDAEHLIQKLDLAVETPRRTWDRAPVGAYYAIPEVIAGIPLSARRQVMTNDERAPISVLVSTSSSAGIDAKTLRKRGVVIMAMVMALSRVRPVSLHTLSFMDGPRDHSGETIFTAHINTSPLDLATACYALTSSGFSRRMTYDLGRALNGFTGMWPRNYQYGRRQNEYYDYLKGLMGLEPTKTLIIGSPELGDKLLKEPIVWIQDQITRFTSQQEELV
jgi:hypothetical protein